MTFPPKVWDDVLHRLSGELPASVVETWLAPVVAELSGDRLRLLCPNQFHRDRVRSVALPRLVASVREAVGRPIEVVLEIADPATAARARFERKCAVDAREREPERKTPEQAAEHPSVGAAQVSNTVSQLVRALSDPKRAGSATTATASAPPPAPSAPQRDDLADLQTERVVAKARLPEQRRFAYTFDNFVVGPCNALAREASFALAHTEQEGLQQLYLNSSPGLGKTHLCRAAAAEAQSRPDQRVLYTSAEEFTAAFTSALRSKQIARFKQRFRKDPRILLVEDIHFFEGKRQTQLEFFHTVRHMLDTGGRVLLTGDRPPRDLTGLEDCLREQLQSGFLAELETPDATVRRGILRAKAARGGIRLPDDCLDLLVESVRGSVRELEGVLIQLVTTSSLLKKSIDIALTREALSRRIGTPEAEGQLLDIPAVLGVVASFFKTTPEAMAARSRRRDVVVPRQLAMYLCRKYTNGSLSEIGAAFGRNHPAVRNAVAKTERAMLERAPLRYQVEALTSRLDELAGRQ